MCVSSAWAWAWVCAAWIALSEGASQVRAAPYSPLASPSRRGQGQLQLQPRLQLHLNWLHESINCSRSIAASLHTVCLPPCLIPSRLPHPLPTSAPPDCARHDRGSKIPGIDLVDLRLRHVDDMSASATVHLPICEWPVRLGTVPLPRPLPLPHLPFPSPSSTLVFTSLIAVVCCSC